MLLGSARRAAASARREAPSQRALLLSSLDRRPWIAQHTLAWPAIVIAVLGVLCAAALWALSLQHVDPHQMSDLGLVSVLPPTTFIAYAILTVSFCLALHQRTIYTPIMLLHVIVLIIMIHGTPNILYGTLRYSWAWKHIGIVDYILRHGSVDPTISYENVYHDWPGFFALSAFITEVAGFKSALSFAGWAPAAYNLLDLSALLLIFRSFTLDQRLIWLSIWFFYLTNWVGQDYFSPQATAYFLHLVILGICLTWFRVTKPPTRAAIRRWLVSDRLAAVVQQRFSRWLGYDTRLATTGPWQRTGLMAMIILLFVMIVSSHQLTPFMTMLALMALIIFQRCSARSLPIMMACVTMIWALYVAAPFVRTNMDWIVQSFGQPQGNANANLIDLSLASPGMRFIAYMSRGLTAFVWLLAVLGLLRRLRWRSWNLPVAFLAAATVPMLVANSYGGEMLFRVYLFSLPFMAYLAASLLYPSTAFLAPSLLSSTAQLRRTWGMPVVAMLLSGLLLIGLFFAYYGKERMYYFSKDEVAAAQFLYHTAPKGSLLLDGTWNYPWAFYDYEYFTYESLMLIQPSGSRVPLRDQAILRQHPVQVIARLLDNSRYTATFLIITRSQKADVDMTGWMPRGSLERIQQALLHSSRFKVIFANQDATIFTLKQARTDAAQTRASSAPQITTTAQRGGTAATGTAASKPKGAR